MNNNQPYVKRRLIALGVLLVIVTVVGTMVVTANAMRKEAPRQYPCQTIQECRNDLARADRAIEWQQDQRRERLRRYYAPTSIAAIQHAAVVYHVPSGDMIGIADCETGGTFDPNSTNGQYLGLFQLSKRHRQDAIIRTFGWRDPLAQALHTARYIALHGEGEWQCRPDGSLRW